MAYRKQPPVNIAPATSPRNGSRTEDSSSRGVTVGSKITPSVPLAIPGTRMQPPVPPALPPPTHLAFIENPDVPDYGALWGERDVSSLGSPTSVSTQDRRDSRRSIHDDDFIQRKHSTSMISPSIGSPLFNESFNSRSNEYKDPVASPTRPTGDNMLNVQRQSMSMSYAYDDMQKRKIGGFTPGRPFQQASFDLPSRGPPSRNVSLPNKSLTLRSLSLQDGPGPESPRKLSSSNNPHWDPASGSQSLLPSPSMMSSQQSYFTNDIRGSPITDTFSSASSMTSYGGSAQSVELAFGRHSGPPRRLARESDLSLAMTAQSALRAAKSTASPICVSPTSNINSAAITSVRQNTHPQDVLQTGDTASLRPLYQQEEIIILPTNHSDHLAHPTHHRLIMPQKRKGAPDASERDGPPSQQIQQEGKRSPNPSKPYPSPRSGAFAQPQHHPISSSGDRLPHSVNPLSDHDPNSPYLNTLAIDPGLDGGAHPYPVDAQQLAAAAAQSVSVNNLPSSEQVETLSAPNPIGGWQCECCLKKPKRFNTELELRAHMNEKQYVCPYCRNRFKNKNEMERHQMSLHLRDRSWSCAALERNYEAAFHPATAIPPNNPGHAQQMVPPPPAATDVCGYCGQHFPNPPDFVARGEHLTNVHKFAECNQSKKFWRADHFRQHLKHSHGGIPGKWTNMLEQACLKMEPSPLTPQQQEDAGGMAQQQVAHAARAAQAAAEQAQQAVQQQQQQAQRQKQMPHRPEDSLHLPPLTTYQATQLQNATASAGMGLPSVDAQRGPYPSTANDFGPVVGGGSD